MNLPNPKKILIVEDQSDIRDIIRFHLETEGYSVIETDRGDSVIRIIEKERPDLITLDIMLPGIDGFELLRLIKSDPRPEISKVPVVVISMFAQEANKYQRGFTEFLSKPFEKHQLINAVQNVLAEVEKTKKLSGKILIADDEEDIVDIISLYLNSIGYKSIKAFNGLEAIIKAKQENPDLVILDIQMPILNGFDVIKDLKNDAYTSSIPIIILTGTHFSPEDKKYGLKLGAAKYITKPFDFAALINDIKETLCEDRKS